MSRRTMRYRRAPVAFVDKERLNGAFKCLRSLGYVARQNHTCCGTCGWYELPEGSTKVVFYHRQAGDRMAEGGDLYLQWSGDGQQIADVFHRYGLSVKWARTENDAIVVEAGNPVAHDHPPAPTTQERLDRYPVY